MTVTLQPVFEALGYRDATAQRAMVRLLQASGSFGDLPNINGVISDKQAQAILDHVTFDNAEQAAYWLHVVTQEHMIRRAPGVERHECIEEDYFQKHRTDLQAALRDVGMNPDIKPTQKYYDHLLLHGSMEDVVTGRIDSLKKLWDEGVRFGAIYLLGSERPLNAVFEPSANKGAKTEMQMIEAHTFEKQKSWPPAMQSVPVISVNTLNGPNGERANTRDTILSWLNAEPKPKPGSVLAVSNQPYVHYQDAAARSALPAGFTLETVGAAAEKDCKISICIDSLAREIDVNFAHLLEKLATHEHTLATPLIGINPADIKVDAATYQFRSGGDGKGVTHTGRHNVDHWDPILHGDPILLHERKDGSKYVADGHHRVDLAKRLNEQGKGPGNILAMVLSEKQGYSAQDVKIIAAYKNMAHGKCNPVDAARVFKEAESPAVHGGLLPKLDMKKGNLPLSYKLSKLSDKALGSVANGEVPAEMAAQVADRVPGDAARQESVMSILKEKLGFADKLKHDRSKTAENGLSI